MFTIRLSNLFPLAVLITGSLLTLPVSANVSPCTSTGTEVSFGSSSYWDFGNTTCTSQQQQAWIRRHVFENDPDNDDVSFRAQYIAYLNRIYQGYTPSDQEFFNAKKGFAEAFREAELDSSLLDYLISFGPNYLDADLSDVMLVGDVDSALAWASSNFDVGDRAVRLLAGEEGEKVDFYTEDGFRTTGFDKFGDFDYTAFGIWGSDSFWGFWRSPQEPEGVGIGDLEQLLSAVFNLLTPTDVVFVAGGRNPSMPVSGTWEGIAFGKVRGPVDNLVRTGFDDVIIGKASLSVHIDENGEGAVDATMDGFESELAWFDIPLNAGGSFANPREYGTYGELDTDLIFRGSDAVGEYFGNTADTIRGQFFGEDGKEVAGVFERTDIIGSFGALCTACLSPSPPVPGDPDDGHAIADPVP